MFRKLITAYSENYAEHINKTLRKKFPATDVNAGGS